jgi:uncharacterized membrane protein
LHRWNRHARITTFRRSKLHRLYECAVGQTQACRVSHLHSDGQQHYAGPHGIRIIMTDQLVPTLIFAATLGTGLIAGVFYAFSTFVMKALARQPAAEGMAAMQAINVAVINPLFLGVFLGTAAACAGAAVVALLWCERPGASLLLAGAALYLVGTFGVTMAANVPLNNALAQLTRDDPDAPRRWAEYVSRWTTWNHVRTAAAVAAAGSFTIAFRLGAAHP